MWRSVVIALLLAGCALAQPAGTAGVVVDQNGKPLAGVHVRLITGDFNSNDGVETVYGATSDAAGQFSMEGLKPGLYIVMAERTGYIEQSSSPLPILALKPGQHLTDHKIVMAARAMIAGHVLDEFGDPVQGVDVHVEPVSPNQSQNFLFGRRYVG
jgi:protocatechuate 3,4-dioxygenase beta subunit